MKGAAKMKENKTIKIITMITGILTVLLGFYAVVRPMRTFLAIGWILGMLLFVNGIELVILSLSKEKKDIGDVFLESWKDLAVSFYCSVAYRDFSQISWQLIWLEPAS